MSYRRQIQAHYHNFISAIRTISMPHWLVGKNMRVGLLSFVFLLSVAYILRVNSAAASGYEAHALEKQVAELNADLQSVNIKIADAGSMVNIEKRLQDMNLITADKIIRYNSAAAVAMAR